ncbi:hypothetical protein P154DRAFT_615011 [Amniculicola lignicola CBS 123094]|uniref:Ankyrin n=1 Tax=Amniculicola lignicola CBS 123094 TaxID=1392246 RepID=A0A6A5X0K7_9PLEO|nr:hypothetical protein P154DRAFT_615011 [Amniculicola lignicola CBS 123094]
MHLMDLPLIIVQAILAWLARSEGLHHLLRQRAVNRLFDGEIVKAIARHRVKELDDRFPSIVRCASSDRRIIAESLIVRLMFENFRVKRAFMNDIQARVHAIAKALLHSLGKVAIQIDYCQALWHVCRTVIGAYAARSNAPLRSLYDETPQTAESRGLTTHNINDYVFILAISVPYPALYQSMLENGFHPKDTKFLLSPLNSVATFGRKEEVKRMLDLEVASSESRCSLEYAFQEAAARGNMEAIETFMDPIYGLDEDAKICVDAAKSAIIFGHHTAAEVCLRRHTKHITLKNRKWLCVIAAEHGSLDILQRYMRGHIDPTNILQQATISGWPPISAVRILLDHGAKICESPGYRDCFYNAVYRGHVELVQFFLDTGINLKADYKDFSSFRITNYISVPLLQCLFDNGLNFGSPKAREYIIRALNDAVFKRKVDLARWYEEVLMIDSHHL